MMVVSSGFLMLSRFEVPPKATRMITNHPDATATLWVEAGAVQLVGGPSGELHGGPIPLDRGPIAVTNSSTTETAIVFAAMAHRAPSAASVETTTFTASSLVAEAGIVAEAGMVAGPLAGARGRLCSVVCPEDQRTLGTDLTPQRADSLARLHNTDTGHSAFIQNQ